MRVPPWHPLAHPEIYAARLYCAAKRHTFAEQQAVDALFLRFLAIFKMLATRARWERAMLHPNLAQSPVDMTKRLYSSRHPIILPPSPYGVCVEGEENHALSFLLLSSTLYRETRLAKL